MSRPPQVLAVSSSLRAESYTRTALKYVPEAAEDAGAETTLLDLGAYDLPVYNPDIDDQGDGAAVMKLAREADAIAIGTPVYHGTFSGAFKNFHDYCGWDEFEDTTVGLLATAGGGSYGPTLDHLRSTMRGVHAWVLPHQVGIRNAADKFEYDPAAIDERAFIDSSLEDRVEKLGRQLVEYAFIDDRQPPEIPTTDD